MTISAQTLFNTFIQTLDAGLNDQTDDVERTFTFKFVYDYDDDSDTPIYDVRQFSDHDQKSLLDYSRQDDQSDMTVNYVRLLMAISSIILNWGLSLNNYFERPLSELWPLLNAANSIIDVMPEELMDAAETLDWKL